MNYQTSGHYTVGVFSSSEGKVNITAITNFNKKDHRQTKLLLESAILSYLFC